MNAYYKGQPIFGQRGPAGPDGNPVGTVISFLGLTAPAGYLVCDGAAHNISDYPDLAAFFETQFGAANHFGGDGTATFAVPDMRNLFLRGYHGAAAEQLSGEVGARQEGTEIPLMYKGISAYSGKSYIGSTFVEKGEFTLGSSFDTKKVAKSANSFDLTGEPSTVTDGRPHTFTARPVNMAVLYCVKAV